MAFATKVTVQFFVIFFSEHTQADSSLVVVVIWSVVSVLK